MTRPKSICIPTYNRYNLKDAKTLKVLAKFNPRCFTLIVVRRSQKQLYQSLLKELGIRERVRILTIGERGVVHARNAGVKYLQSLGYAKMIIMDDDLTFAVRTGPSLPLIKDSKTYQQFLSMIFSLLDQYAHVGVSTRIANRGGEPDYRELVRGHTCVGYRLDILKKHAITFDYVLEGREGMDMTLMLLKDGYPNAVLFKYSINSIQHSVVRDVLAAKHTKGNTQEFSTLSAQKLCTKHPGLITLIEKNYKSGKRTEVRVNWKKALKQPRKKVLKCQKKL